jgi:hypothetical protein
MDSFKNAETSLVEESVRDEFKTYCEIARALY